jgi:hypothetical protein
MPPHRSVIYRLEAASATGATAIRNMIVDAWLDSANTPVGYPMVNVRDIESGTVRATH